MTTYDVALEGPNDWEIDTSATTVFDFDYKGGRDQLLRLYDKGTRRQVIDEARHVEVYSRYLYDKVQLVYPLNKNLESLLNDVIEDSRWDMTYLGMQVLIEGLALAAFGTIRNMATEPLAKAINAYVMQGDLDGAMANDEKAAEDIDQARMAHINEVAAEAG